MTTAAPDAGESEPSTAPPTKRARRLERVGLAAFALAVYVPIMSMHAGKVVGDTKTYLYLDPSRFLARAASLWDAKFALGTLSHQTIGYLFPVGPYYWFLEEVLRIPAWVAQRLWLASIVFAAGLGIRYLMRTIGVGGPGIAVAMLTYAFTPYVLGYASIYSVLLLPWAALPWWVGFADRGLRRGGWKYPALFAITVQVVGSLNGSALLFAALAPALWVPYAVGILRTASWGRAWSLLWRTAMLTVLASLWWLVSLVVEGQTGVNILRFTESISVVSATSSPVEIVRGLGNWFFYGGDVAGYWVTARPYFTQRALFVLVSLLIPAMALLAAGTIRWRARAFFAWMVLLGVVIAVGAAPYDDPSLLGSAYKSFASSSTLGFALRNTGRAVPLVVLGMSVLLGAGVSALTLWLRRHGRPRLATATVGVVVALCIVNTLPAVLGGYFSPGLERGDVPGYWKRAIAALDARPHDTRVLALPGSDFASYRWGDTREPIEPGLMDRPYVARELVPWGSPESLNLLRALDRRVQESALEPDALAPIARLMGVGDVLLRSDLRTDRYSVIPATSLWRTLTDPVPAGLGPLERFGSRIPGKLKGREIGDFTRPVGDRPDVAPVAVLPVHDPIPIVRTKSTAAPTVVAGDGEGLIDIAAAGMLDARRLVLYSAPFEDDRAALRALPDDAALVITDSNRRRGSRWSGLANNFGYTEQAGEVPLREDLSDQRLDPFPGSTDASRTVTILDGVKSVRATSYGEPVFGFSPAQRPTMAIDGDRKTAWTAGAGTSAEGERLQIDLDAPITTDRVNLVQFSGKFAGQEARAKRSIANITLRFDGDEEVHATIRDSSRRAAGQVVRFAPRSFRRLDITIDKLRGRTSLRAGSKNAVGWSEVRLRDDRPGAETVRASEVTRMPKDLLAGLGERSGDHPLAIVMSRADPTLARQFSLPTARDFELSGTASLGALATDAAIDRAIGLPDAESGGLTATSSARLGPPVTRASSAFDGDPTTAWQTPIGTPRKSITFRTPTPILVDHLDLQLVADGRHSLPTRLSIRAGDGAKQVLVVPPQPVTTPSGVVTVPLQFPLMQGDRFTVKVEQFRRVKRNTLTMPVGVAELGVAGVVRGAVPEQMPETCFSDLVEVDGAGTEVRVSGTTAAALAGGALTVSPCGPALSLDAGTHVVRARESARNPLGIDVTRLVLTSGAGGGAVPPEAFEKPPDATPRIRTLSEGRSSMKLRVSDVTQPFWLVLGQSQNDGWVATVDGKKLGASQLVDGYANGWLVRPGGRDTLTVSLVWEPQRIVGTTIAISAATFLLALGIVVAAFLRGRRRGSGDVTTLVEPVLSPGNPVLARRMAATIGTVSAVTIVGALTVRPWVGLGVGALTLLAIRVPGWRFVLRLAPAALMVGVAFYVSVTQFLVRYPPRFDWVTFYDEMRVPTWTAVLLIAADALIAVVWRAERAPIREPSAS